MKNQKSETDRRISVVEAEDQMLDAYRRKAAADLGPGATEADIERAAENAYWNRGRSTTRQSCSGTARGSSTPRGRMFTTVT